MRRLLIPMVSLLLAAGTADGSRIAPWKPPSAPGYPGIASWPYRMFDAGLEVFARQRHYAPAAQLSFKLITDPPSRLQGLSLELRGPGWWLPVMDSAGSFTLDRNTQARDEDAWLVSNRSYDELGTNTIWVQVRSQGLPDNSYRMGDLRLQCQVFTVAGYVNTPGLSYEEAIRTADDNHCRRSSGFPDTYVIKHEQPFSAAFIEQDGKRTSIVTEPAEHRLYVPIHDDAWSDDALIVVVPVTRR